jgi:hypothetical protein
MMTNHHLHRQSKQTSFLFGGFGLLVVFIGCSSSSDAATGQPPNSGVACPPGQAACELICVDLTSNNAHCGNCNVACTGNTVCSNGSCVGIPMGGTAAIGAGGTGGVAGGNAGSHNNLVNQLPGVISNAHVVSAAGLSIGVGDEWNLHFGHDSQVTLGTRYGEKMIEALGW